METRQLQLHPMAIYTFIRAQAGSLGKAIAEMAMNSLDAFAKEVRITVSQTGFTVTDNGMGFRDKSEIAAWFETLGFPHDEGNHRIWGAFGLGRAQAWAFASTVWRSNEFVMDVDVKARGLDYSLTTAKVPVAGTTIEGKLYTQLTLPEVMALQRELRSLLKYVAQPIFLNGELISVDPKNETWDLETPEAWISFKAPEGRVLTVYNGGVLVTRYDRWRFQITGVVVTKPEAQLALNVARTDILVAECKVWAKIRKAFPVKTAAVKKEAPVVTSKETQAQLAEGLKDSTLTLAAVLESAPDLLKTIRGRKFSLKDFFDYKRSDLPVLFAPPSCLKAREIARVGAAIVLDDSVLTALALSPAQFREKAIAAHRAYAKSCKMAYLDQILDRYTAQWSTDPVELCPWVLDDCRPLAKKDLNAAEEDARAAWTYALGQALGPFRKLVQCDWVGAVVLGTSTSKETWMMHGDGGAKPVLVLRKDFAVKAANQGLLSAIPAMLQAYETLLKALVPADELAATHRTLLEGEVLGIACAGLLAKTATLRTARGTAVAQTLLRHVKAINPFETDELHEESGSPPSSTVAAASAVA